MYHVANQERENKLAERMELLNQENIWTFGEKEHYKYLGILENGHHLIRGGEGDNKKRVPQKNEKDSRNQAL